MKGYLKYTPGPNIKRSIDYKEVWQGLPASISEFMMVPLHDGHKAWSYEDDSLSIWVIDSVMKAYRKNPRGIFVALMCKKERDSQRDTVIGMRVFEGSIDDAIKDVTLLNRQNIRSCGIKNNSRGIREDRYCTEAITPAVKHC